MEENQMLLSRKRPANDMGHVTDGKRFKTGQEIRPNQSLMEIIECFLSPRVRVTPRQAYLDDLFNRITIDKADKQASKRLLNKTLQTLMRSVTSQADGGWMYSQQFIYAGSYPVKTKIGKADEFDVNIPLNIDPKRVRLTGTISYSYDGVNQTNSQNLNITRELGYLPEGKQIPPGYAVVEVKLDNFFVPWFRSQPVQRPLTKTVPRKFYHEDLRWNSSTNVFRHIGTADVVRGPSSYTNLNRCAWTNNIELIPRDVKKDLYERLTTRKISQLTWDVFVHAECSGPAVTLTIVPDDGSEIKHHINVDVTLSIPCDVPVTSFGWPRQTTRRAFSHVDILCVINAGTHLVPKKDLFWAISFSKAEKALLMNIDKDQGCRRYVTKLLKKYVQTCKSQSTNGLPGISSHIIKTQVLWSCEKHFDEAGYWHRTNRDVCLLNTMQELETTLGSQSLPEYFNPNLNILDGKRVSVVNELAEFMRQTRIQLSQM